jgi:hypothetical protein
MIIHKWISSDGSELDPTTDFKINFTLPILCYSQSTARPKRRPCLPLFFWLAERNGGSASFKYSFILIGRAFDSLSENRLFTRKSMGVRLRLRRQILGKEEGRLCQSGREIV